MATGTSLGAMFVVILGVLAIDNFAPGIAIGVACSVARGPAKAN